MAHTDLSRDFLLLYLLEGGGPEHRTVFYQEIGMPKIRERDMRVLDYSNLIELGGLQIPLKSWILMQTQILHGVENIPNHRISFQIGIHDITAIKGKLLD
jgi:hypothetical protein